MEINWADPKAKISKYFTVGEALYLPSWNCYHIPTEEQKNAILKTAVKMDIIRDFLAMPINIVCWLRPSKVNCLTFDPKTIKPSTAGQTSYLAELNYNGYIGGAKRSAHMVGQGVDFQCKEICDKTREKLLPKLEEYNIRMEDLPKSTWVHIDTYDKSVSGGNRFFKPY